MDGLRLHGLYAGALAVIRRADRSIAVSHSLTFRIGGRANARRANARANVRRRDRGRNRRSLPGRRDS